MQMPGSMEYQLVECPIVVNAAGAFSAKLAEMLGVSSGSEETFAVPVEPRKRFVFSVGVSVASPRVFKDVILASIRLGWRI